MAENIQINGLKEIELMLSNVKNGAETALMRAINRGVDKGVGIAAKQVSEELNVTQKVVKKSIRTRKASRSSLSGKITSYGEPIPLVSKDSINFGGTKSGRGWGFTIKRSGQGRGGGGRKYFKNAFIMNFSSGGRRIFTRKSSAAGGSKSSGLKALYTSRIPDILDNPERYKKTIDEANAVIATTLEQQIKYLLSK